MLTATMTRSDIACALRAEARVCEYPKLTHEKAVLNVT